MFRLTYLDAYQVERTLSYQDYDELMLSFSGCVTLPDFYEVTSLSYQDKIIYRGYIGDLYRFLTTFDVKKIN